FGPPDDHAEALRRIVESIGEIADALADAELLAPRHTEGTDSKGAVRMRLGHDGWPQSIEVARDWQDLLQPQAFCGAVLDAHADASHTRMTTWGNALQDTDWRYEAERQRHLSGGPWPSDEPPADALPAPEPLRRYGVGLDDMVEELLVACDE